MVKLKAGCPSLEKTKLPENRLFSTYNVCTQKTKLFSYQDFVILIFLRIN